MSNLTEGVDYVGELDNHKPSVSVIVPCRNERDHIEAVLRSILSQEPPVGGFEVIVADGMSNDGTRDILFRLAAECASLRVVDNVNQIIPTGLNTAIKAARGRVIVRMDAHTRYAIDYVQQCIAVLNETGADNVGGPWVAKGLGLVGRAVAAASHSGFAVGGARCHQLTYEGIVDTVYLGCWRADVLQRLQFFDEEFLRSEDDELNLRLTRSGGKIWQSPRIKSWYHPRESLRGLFQQQTQNGYWKVRVMQKHKTPASVRHLVPIISMILSVFLLVLALSWPGALWVWIGLVGLYGICNLFASVLTAKHDGWYLLPVLPLIFGCYHCGYAWGFLRGVLDFVILRRKADASFARLTRSSTE